VAATATEARRRSLAGRAFIAVVLLLGYYALGIAVAAVLIAAPIVEIGLLDRIHFYVAILPLLGLSVLWSMVPRRRTWVEPGIPVDAASQPELVELVRSVAEGTGQPVPAEIYLLDEVNAFVTRRGGVLGIGGHAVIGIGVPLMAVLDGDELRSVLTHEFGHLHGGDARLGPLIYRGREAMGRTLSRGGIAHGLFKAYASFYLRRTQSISRGQELAADALAASVTSPSTTAAALSRLLIGSPAFDAYWQHEYAPILRAGRRPPYLAGFESMLASSSVRRRAAERSVDHQGAGPAEPVALGLGTASSFDSHPPIDERIAALGFDPGAIPVRFRPPFPATVLLRDLPGIDAQLVARQLASDPARLVPIEWADTGTEVLVPAWRAEVVAQLLPVAPGLAPVDVPVTPDDLAALGEAIVRGRGRSATRPERELLARHLCHRLLAVAAVERGWVLQSTPGEELVFAYGEARLDVVDDYLAVCAGELDANDWRGRVRDAGLVALPHPAGGAAAPAPDGGAAAPAPDGGGGAFGTAVAGGLGAPGPALVDAAGQPGPPGPDASPDAPLWFDDTPPGQMVGRRKRLIVAGPELRWGDAVVHADHVTAIAYRAATGDLLVRVTATTGDLTFKIRFNGRIPPRLLDAWRAQVQWSERYVEARLVDGLIDRLRAAGRLDLGGVSFTWDGFTTNKGTFTWNDLVGVDFNGGSVVLYRAADNIDGRSAIGTASAKVDDVVLIPQLCDTILAMRRG
jgi:Zn-dependent protease with chaperone function